MLFRSYEGGTNAGNILKPALSKGDVKIIGATTNRERSEERRVGKSVDLGGRRIIKKTFFQAEDGIRDMSPGDWSSDVCSSDLITPPFISSNPLSLTYSI